MALAAHALGKSTSFIDGRRRNVKTLRQQLADKHSRDFAVMSTRRLRSRKRSSRVTPSPTVVTGTHRTRNQVRWGLMVHSCNRVQGGKGRGSMPHCGAHHLYTSSRLLTPGAPATLVQPETDSRTFGSLRADSASPTSSRGSPRSFATRASGKSYRSRGVVVRSVTSAGTGRSRTVQRVANASSNWRKANAVVTAANKFKQAGKARRERLSVNREKRKRIFAEKVRACTALGTPVCLPPQQSQLSACCFAAGCSAGQSTSLRGPDCRVL